MCDSFEWQTSLNDNVVNCVVGGTFNGVTQEVSWCPGFHLMGEFRFIMGSKGGSDFSARCNMSRLSRCMVLGKNIMEQYGKNIMEPTDGTTWKGPRCKKKNLDQQSQVQQNHLATL